MMIRVGHKVTLRYPYDDELIRYPYDDKSWI